MSENGTDTTPHGIAVVGMAGRFPGSPDLERFWHNLREGVECVTFFRDEELAASGVDPAELTDPRYVRARGTLEGADLFDPGFFGFTPREAEILDPQHRVFLECAWQALESAGTDTDRFPGRVAVFAGAGAATYLLHNLLPNRQLLEKVGSLQALLMNEGDFLTTRVSYKLNLKGPSVDVQTACSTGLVAVHMACQSLLAGESDMALAGGVSVDVPQVSGYLYQESGVMSPDGHCRAFDERAAGTVNGSGAGVVVLKRLADALADGDPVHAVILGSAINNDGSAKVGFTAPSVEGQSEAIAESLLMAGVDPATVSYVETHGSGTPLGDPVEIEALSLAFRSAMEAMEGGNPERAGFCAVGSVKTNLGHCNAAAGIAGLLKTILALEHREIPPSLHFERPNPQIDFAASPFYVADRLQPWLQGDSPRRAGVSSFGLGGTNAHVVLEEAPPPAPSAPASRPAQLLVLSARTPEALERAAENLAAHLESRPDLELADVAWTLQMGRKGFEHRRAVVAAGVADAVAALRDARSGVFGKREGTGGRPAVFLFPGLGDQYLDMARGLYESEPVFREVFDLCAEGLRPEMGIDLREAVFSGGPARTAGKSAGPDLRAMLRRGTGPQDPASARLAETAVAQPACFAVEYALARLLMSWGIQPQAMIGYSIGEYVAACLAGVLSLDDALRVVARRARLIQELPAGAMLAVPLAEDAARPLLAETDPRLSLSATNGPHFCVAGGPAEAVEALERRLAERGVSAIRLQTTHAFHTAMMEPAVAAFREALRGVTMHPPEIPYLSNVTGTWITPEDLAPDYWARHMTGTMRFAEGLGELLAVRERLFVEVGPGGTLGTLARQHPGAPAGLVAVSTLRRGSEERPDVGHLLEAVGRLWMAGGEVDWAAFHRGEGGEGGERRMRVPLPAYPFERRRCWIDPPRPGEAAHRMASLPPAEPGVEAAAPAPDVESWAWLPIWRQAPPAELFGGKKADGGGWLIFTDAGGLGERLAERLRRSGRRVFTVGQGPAFAGRAGYEELLQRLRAEGDGRVPGHVLHLWGLTDEAPSYEVAQQAGLLSLMFLEQALTNLPGGFLGKSGGSIRIGMVSSHLHEVVDGDRVEPAKATVLGACKVIHQESAHLTCCSIDAAPPVPGSPAEERLIGQLLAELSVPEAEIEPAVAYRGRQRWVRRFERVPLPREAGGASLMRAGGAYLITDAAHAVGLGLADVLTGELGARVALVLPPAFPPREKWEGWTGLPEVPPGQDVAGTAIRRLLEIERRRGALLLRADLTAAGSMRAALAAARESFGRLDGVFHTAGWFTGGLIQLKTPESLEASLRPVTRGAEALFAALDAQSVEERPGFAVLTGSTLTFAGGLGQLDIAAAGAYVDALAQRRAADGDGRLAVLAVHWDPYQWDGWLAMGAAPLPGLSPEQLQQDLAAYGTPASRSAEALRRLLGTPLSLLSRAAVSARDLHALIAETDAFTADVFLAQMEKAQHGKARAGRAGIAIPYAEPRSELERQVAAIWEELFGIQPIGADDNFLELGGHSLLAIQMATQLRQAFAVDLPVTVLFEAPTVGELAAVIEGGQVGAGEEAAQAGRTHQPPPIPRLSPPDGAGDWPLSFDQERMWALFYLDPQGTAYNIDTATLLKGPFRVEVFRRAMAEIVRRHAAWRTVFAVVDGAPVQRVLPRMEVPLPLVDLTALPEARRRPEALAVQAVDGRTPFDLERGPLVRVALLRLAPQEHIFLVTVHHIVTDWVTFQLFWRELAALYEAYGHGAPSPLPEPPVHFSDYAVWQRGWMAGEVLDDLLGWWREQLQDMPLVLDLPTDRPRPAVNLMRGGQVPLATRPGLAEEVHALARREGLTPFMAVLAVVKILLHLFSGQEKILLGSNNANRNRPEIETVLGFFLTQVAFATDLSGDPTVRDVLARVRKVALGAYAHQDLPFIKLIEGLQPERDASRQPLVQSLVLLLDGSHVEHQLAEGSFHGVQVFDGNSRYDLMFGLWAVPDAIYGAMEYNSDLFDASTAVRLGAAFLRLLEAAAADPGLRLSQLPFLGEAARHQLLAEWNDTVAGAAGGTVLERLAKCDVEAPALFFAQEVVAYGDLDRASNRLARHLRSFGVGRESRVALLLERSPELVISLLGVWKAGGATVVLDPTLPSERLGVLLADAEPAVLLHSGPHGLDLPAAGARRLDLTGEGERIALRDDGPLTPLPAPADLAYLIYTSGTTGTPKAVLVEHGSLAHTLDALVSRFAFSPGDRMPHLARFSFDISLFELLAPLLGGGACEILTEDEVLEPRRLLAALSQATQVHAVPSLMRQIALQAREHQLPNLRAIFTGGDLVPPDLIDELLEVFPGAEINVLYGPTEAAIVCSAWRVPKIDAGGPGAGLPEQATGRAAFQAPEGAAQGRTGPRTGPQASRNLIGRPLSGVRFLVHDRLGRLAPPGVPGELSVGGPGVARGYLHRPELTTEKFFARDGLRWYRTGDLVRWLPDGNLEFLGRTDNQVKIRGFRVEPAEIEAALAAHPAVREAAVVAREEGRGERRLVAYVVMDPSPPNPHSHPHSPLPGEGEGLREHLAARLPAYMVPSAFVVLPGLPLTAHGKVDRGRLPEPQAAARAAFEPPRTPAEERVAEVWREVLRLPRVGCGDDFFELGGHSLLATQAMIRLRDLTGIELPVRLVFQAPTLAEMAAAVEAAAEEHRASGAPGAAAPPLVPLARGGAPLPLSFAQERLWFLDRLAPGSPAYNLPLALRIDGPLDAGALGRAFAALVRRHEALRTTFAERAGKPVQVVADGVDWELAVDDLSSLGAGAEAEARKRAAIDAARPFDLERGPLLRASLLCLANSRHVLLLAIHHIVSDAWSMGLLVSELTALYGGSELPPLSIQYADYAVWQRGWLEGGELERQLDFWRGHLAGAPALLDLPTDRPRPPVQSLRGGRVPVALPADLSAGLAGIARGAGGTLYMALLAAWGALLSRLSGQRDLVVGTAVANRDRPELERLIGFFVNTLALRVDLAGAPPFTGLVERARRTVLDAFAHRDLPFEKLVEEVHPARDRGRQPIFQVMLTFQNVPPGATGLPGLALTPLDVEAGTAKFDLTLSLSEEDGRVQGTLEYASDLFERATAERLAGHLQTLIAGAVASPASTLAELLLLSAAERAQILEAWSGTASGFPREATVHGLFAGQAARTPEAVAILQGDESLTYGELARRAGRLARRLLALGVAPEERVGLCAGRSFDLIAALLGILEAGAAYLPLDPSHPPERLAWMLKDAGARAVLAERRLLAAAPGSLGGLRVLWLEDLETDEEPPALPLPRVPAASLAYVMYTSGSTGTPKGVAITHRNVVRLVRGADYAEMGPGQTWLQFAPVSFDAATLEIWAPLLNGGRLALFPGQRAALDELGAAIGRHGVTSLWLTAGLFHQMVDQNVSALRPLRQLLAGGDAVSPVQARRVLEALPGLTLIDGYGPTEGTTFTCAYRMTDPRQVGATVPIGTPIANARVYVVDGSMQPVPAGVAGELWIGGEGLARGYLGRPDLTAERFVPDPFGREGGERLYRTGDRVRFRADGALEFLGRLDGDGQVKIRGFRIEAGEIEAALESHPAVRRAAVAARWVRGEEAAGRELVACVVMTDPASPAPAAELQRFLRSRLPEPMVPAAWIFADALPLTPNGKVDRRALAGLTGEVRAGAEYLAPRTPLEEHLVAACAQVLGLDRARVSVLDNFFDLGGHSLLATQLLAQLRLEWGVEVPLQLLFDVPTLADLAERITERELADLDPELLQAMLAELGEER